VVVVVVLVVVVAVVVVGVVGVVVAAAITSTIHPSSLLPTSAKPAIGTVPAESFALVAIRFRPGCEPNPNPNPSHNPDPKTYKTRMMITFNGSEDTREDLLLVGLGQVPHLM